MVRTCSTAAVVAFAVGAFLSSCGGGASRPRPVVLITLDTFRWDYLGASREGRADTPHLDRLAGRGVLFEEAFASTPITLPSHASILTGLRPPRHGVRNNGNFALSADAVTLAEILSGAGWRCAAAIGAHPVDRRYGMAQGYHEFDARLPKQEKRLLAERSALAVTDAALAAADVVLQGGDGPLHLWAHYFDAHAPYLPPEPYASRWPDHPYRAEVEALDEQVGRLLDGLEERGLLQDAIVILTADHGEALGAHGELSHSLLLHAETTRVPLVVVAPEFGTGRSSVRVRTIDILPTILDLVGLDGPSAVEGLSLRPIVEGAETAPRTAYSETLATWHHHGWSPLFALRDGDRSLWHGPRSLLFAWPEDHQELRDLASLEPERLREMVTTLETLQRESASRALGDSRRVLAVDEQLALEALGYVSTGDQQEVDAPTQPTGTDPLLQIARFAESDRARDLLDRGLPDEALALFDELLEADPGNQQAHRYRGLALLALGRTDEAEAALRTALQMRPDDPALAYELVWLLVRQGEREDALEILEAAILLSDHMPDLHAERGRLLFEVGRLESAIPSLQHALQLDPHSKDTRRLLARALSAAGRNDEAQEVLDGE